MAPNEFLRKIIDTVGGYSNSLIDIPIAHEPKHFNQISALMNKGYGATAHFYGFFLPEEPNTHNGHPVSLYLLDDVDFTIFKVGYIENLKEALYKAFENLYLSKNMVSVAIVTIKTDPNSKSGYKLDVKSPPPVLPQWRVRGGLVELGDFLEQYLN